ncbi:mercury resistance system transport protein MerF [Rhodocaloribacter sp.]
MSRLTDNKLVFWGGLGALVAGVCCFTPLLVWGLAALGLAAFGAYLDWVLLPLLFLFVAMVLVGLDRAKKQRGEAACEVSSENPGA